MKNVLLKFYPKNNLGDDLFVKIITERYKNTFSLVLKDKNRFLENVDNLKLYNNRFVYILFKLIEKAFKKKDIWFNLIKRKNDLMVYIGGSIFIEQNNLPYWRKESTFYRGLGLPYYILGSNFGPYSTSEFKEIVTTILKGARDVCFRDTNSYELFKGLEHARVATDVVFSLDTSRYTINKEKIAIFSMIDGNDRFDKSIVEKYDHEMKVMTEKLVNNGYRVIYMSFCKFEGDEVVNERIVNSLDKITRRKVETFNYDGNLEEALSILAKSEIIVATRFHALILGLLFSKKVLPMAYSKKTSNILHDLNFKGEIVDINEIRQFNGNDIDFTKLKVTDVADQVALANLQFQELDKVLVRKK